MATEAVLNYLKSQNRPYSANDIMENLHKKYGKTAIQKSLDSLTQSKQILEKIYGKQKVYCIIQEDDSSTDNLDSMNDQIAKLQQTLKSNEENIKTLETELKSLQGQLTLQEAQEENKKLMEDVDKLNSKLNRLKSTTVIIDPEEKKKVQQLYETNLKTYKKRKRICTDILNSILESYPKKKSDLFEEIGIETDEDVNCTLVGKN